MFQTWFYQCRSGRVRRQAIDTLRACGDRELTAVDTFQAGVEALVDQAAWHMDRSGL
jgi:hypothetical protein